MKIMLKCLSMALALWFVGGCATLDRYKKADESKHEIRSLALLPLIVGDENGRIEKLGSTEVQEFLRYFNDRFWSDFEGQVTLIDSIELMLPGRDFNIQAYNGMDYLAAARELGVDAVLGINLTLYNEVKPGAKGAQIAGAVITTLLFGGYVRENQIVGYATHYAYLDMEKVDESLSFKFAGKSFPTIDEQRAYFVDVLLAYLDRSFPLSSDYVPAYK